MPREPLIKSEVPVVQGCATKINNDKLLILKQGANRICAVACSDKSRRDLFRASLGVSDSIGASLYRLREACGAKKNPCVTGSYLFLKKTNSSDNWQQLLHFVEQERGKYQVPLTSDMELFAQLGLEGDDALEFLDHYATEFRVDMTGFDYQQYFGPEGLDVASIIASLFSRKGRQPYKPLTLGDLHDAMIRGRWKQEA